MVKRLRFSKIDLVERTGALMLVTYLDDAGEMYQWAPKWADVEQIFLKQINVERFNKPESEFLNKFARTTQNVVEGAQRIRSAHKLSGRLGRYSDDKLVITPTLGEVAEYLIPAFEVTLKFLDDWLGESVEAFVVNDMIIRLTKWGPQQEGEEYVTLISYPPNDAQSP